MTPDEELQAYARVKDRFARYHSALTEARDALRAAYSAMEEILPVNNHRTQVLSQIRAAGERANAILGRSAAR